MFHERKEHSFNAIALDDLSRVARACLTLAEAYRVWLFHGEMGAGKTTLIKAIGHELGVIDTMSSPTFSIMNEYSTADGEIIYHFDFFRIKSEAEAYDIGAEEYFYSGKYCLVEWPERIHTLIPDAHVNITISHETETHRTIVLSVHDGKEKNRI